MCRYLLRTWRPKKTPYGFVAGVTSLYVSTLCPGQITFGLYHGGKLVQRLKWIAQRQVTCTLYILYKGRSTRYDLSYTIVILTYDNECWCQIFAHSSMANFETCHLHACLFDHGQGQNRIWQIVSLFSFLAAKFKISIKNFLCQSHVKHPT